MTTLLPFNRIAFYKDVYYPHSTKVHTIIKHRPSIVAPTFHDTFYYTIPVRDKACTSFKNAILAFNCKSQADAFCKALNLADEDVHRSNHNEPMTAASCKVDDYNISDLTFYAHHLCVPLVLVCNQYCQGTHREPHFEVMFIDTIN